MRLAIPYRTATHHNMMLDPCVLCESSRFVIIALITLIDPRSLGVSSYAHIALLEQRFTLRFFHDNILTGQFSEPLRKSRT
jgi:disulfide bond formation protein DsbB